jgi:hypothetical protein
MTKIAGFGSISQRHGCAEPDTSQNVMDPQHCLQVLKSAYESKNGPKNDKYKKRVSYFTELNVLFFEEPEASPAALKSFKEAIEEILHS